MNDFSELESELKKLSPARPSHGLLVRVELALADAGKIPDDVIQPHRFRVNWFGMGLAATAAASLLILAWINSHPAQKAPATIASPALPQSAAQLPSYSAEGLTQVVYKRRDEGLVFPVGADGPSRRVVTATRQTLRWRDPRTGASLRVSYPMEETMLIPVSGQ